MKAVRNLMCQADHVRTGALYRNAPLALLLRFFCIHSREWLWCLRVATEFFLHKCEYGFLVEPSSYGERGIVRPIEIVIELIQALYRYSFYVAFPTDSGM